MASRRGTMHHSAAAVLARALGRGATVFGPDGRDVSQAVRAAFRAALPASGGDRAAAAARAVSVALGGAQRREGR